jgi:hypothetical protein
MEDQTDNGVTREADIAATTAVPGSRPTPPRAPLGGSGVHSPSTGGYPRAPRTGSGFAPQAPQDAAPATSRFCGTCGARLEPGRPFCGQCGTPVSVSGVHNSTAMRAAPSGSGVYRTGSSAQWPRQIDGDSPTVAEMPMQDLYGEGDYQGEYQVDDSSRTMRIVVGILCLIGSFATAVAAIVLALATFH